MFIKKNYHVYKEKLVIYIPDFSDLLAITYLNKKINGVEKKIPDVSGLVNTRVFNIKVGEVGNKIRDVSYWIRKTDYNSKYQTLN